MRALTCGGRLLLAAVAACWLSPARAEDPALLWSRAVTHMRAQEPAQALPLLDRLQVLAPGNAAIRLEQGLAQFQLGQDGAARQSFRTAADLPLTPPQRRAMEVYLARIEARRPWRFHLSGGLRPQSNPARRTELEQVTLGGMQFTLDERRDSGIGADFAAGLSWRQPPGAAIRPGISATIAGTVYENRLWNDYTLSADASLAFGATARREAAAGVVLRQRWLGDRRYSLDRGGFVTQGWLLAPGTVLSLRGEAVWRDYASGRAGARIPKIAVSVTHRLSDRTGLRALASLARTDSAIRPDSMTTTILGIGLTHRFAEDWLAELDGLVARDRRDAPDPVFGLTRNETETRLRLRLGHQGIRIGDFSPALEIGRERRSSPIGLYSWSNSYVGFTMSRRF